MAVNLGVWHTNFMALSTAGDGLLIACQCHNGVISGLTRASIG